MKKGFPKNITNGRRGGETRGLDSSTVKGRKKPSRGQYGGEKVGKEPTVEFLLRGLFQVGGLQSSGRPGESRCQGDFPLRGGLTSLTPGKRPLDTREPGLVHGYRPREGTRRQNTLLGGGTGKGV